MIKWFAPLSLAAVVTACLASPPGHLPSSVRVIYSKAVDDSLGQRKDIFFLVARSGNELQLTGEDGFDGGPDFAAGLRKVFYTRQVTGARQIWSVDLDGSNEAVLLSGIGEEFSDPSISPDETQIAYLRTTGGTSRIEVASIDGSNPRTVVEGGGGAWRQPRWSPDGRSLALTGVRDGVDRLFIVNATGGAPRPIAPNESAAQSDPNWSHDGARIVFKLGIGAAAEIAVVDVSAGVVTRLTDNDVEDSAPAFNPSGDRIIFVSQRPHGHDNLWVMGSDGKNVDSLTRERGADAADPEWI